MRIRSRKELGAIMREKRRQQTMTQAQLAEAVGVSRRWVVQVERGQTSADLRTLLRALKVLRLEIRIQPRQVSEAAKEVTEMLDAPRAGR